MKRILLLVGIITSLINVGFAQTSKEEKKKQLKAPWFVEKFTISAGGFVPISNTDLQVSATAGNKTVGTEINFENDLGFTRSSTTFMADVQYRLTRRSRFDLSFYQINRSANKTLAKDIVFDDDTFHIHDQTHAFFNTGIYRFSYGYSIITNDKFEVGLLIGVHILGSNAGLSNVGTNVNVAISKNFGFTAPLPDFGVWGGYAFSNRWYANGEFDYFAISIGDINGSLTGGHFGVTYRAYKKLDITAGYTGFHFKVDITKPRAYGSLKWGYSGPSLTLSYSFGKKGWSN